jgi:isopentenyldiphosphate isomerase
MVEHELDRVFVVTIDGEPRPNPSEADDVAWVDGRTLAAMLADVRSVTPWFGLVLAVAARGRDGLSDLVSGAPPPFNHPEVLEVRWSEQAARLPATAAT